MSLRAASAPSASLAPWVIRDVTDPWAMRALEDVQLAAWGYPEREVTPGTLLRISAATGGIVLGAYPAQGEEQQRPVGLAFGFPALADGQTWHHSHLLAVRPGWRGSGLAVAMKLAQRERALGQGHTRMTWTFDPLIARNARLNLGKLGAAAVTYHPDWYALSDDRASAFPADRLMVEWELTRPGAETRAERPAPLPHGPLALERGKGGEPGPPRLELSGDQLLAEVPLQVEGLDGEQRLAWRLALRAVLSAYLTRGYAATDMAREGERAFYVLSRR